MEALNNREIAIIVWIGVAAISILLLPSLRASAFALAAVVRAFLARPILASLVAMFGYLLFVVWLLSELGLWSFAEVKNTAIWTIGVGIASLLRINSISGDPNYFSTAIRDNFKVIVVAEFIATAYAFPLPVELFLVPLVFLAGAIGALSEGKEEQKAVRNFSSGVIAVVGISMFLFSAFEIVTQFGDFAAWATFEDFYTPVLLSLLYLPFVYLLCLYIAYENAFARLSVGIQSASLCRYAKLLAVLRFRTNRALLERFVRNALLQRPTSRADVQGLLRELDEICLREKDPPSVPARGGWSPFKACLFLKSEGIIEGDYHRLYDDEWCASSKFYKVEDGTIPNNIGYYVSGDTYAAKELVLELNVNNIESAQLADESFWLMARTLLLEALATDELGRLGDLAQVEGKLEFDFEGTHIELSRRNHNELGYSRELVIRRGTVGFPKAA